MKKEILVPFAEDGSLLSYDGYGVMERKQNYEFVDRLKVVDYSRGRSSIKIVWQNEEGKQFPMFISDFIKIVDLIDLGYMYAKWTFVKKGANYGIKYVEGGHE